MPRAPGDTTLQSKSKTGVSTFRSKNGAISTSSQTSTVFIDGISGYPKGARAKISGRLWIYPTTYAHNSRKIIQGVASFRNNYADGRWDEYREEVPAINTFVTTTLDVPYNKMDVATKYNVTSAAQVKALTKIGDAKANIGEDLATYLQTVRMFKSKASLLHEILSNFKKGSLGKYAKRSARNLAKSGDKKAAKAYLEYVYGWKPLVSDLYGVYEILKQYSNGVRPLIIHGHGSQHQSSTTDFGTKVTFSGPITGLLTDEYKGTCDLYARVDPNYIALRILNQLGLLNPASFAWELTPWSFVVDWFVPIGPLLAAFTAPIGLNFVSGTYAARVSRTVQGQLHVGGKAATAVSFEDRPCEFTVTDELYDRIALSTWPFPTPYLNLNPLSGDRSYKALALAIAKLR